MGLKALDLPTFCYNPRLPGALYGKYAKPVSCNKTVICDGVEVNPGDLICADNDGVCVFPVGLLEKVVKMVEDTNLKDETAKKKLGSGASLSQTYPMDDLAKKK